MPSSKRFQAFSYSPTAIIAPSLLDVLFQPTLSVLQNKQFLDVILLEDSTL